MATMRLRGFSFKWPETSSFALQAADCVLLLFCLCPCQQDVSLGECVFVITC